MAATCSLPLLAGCSSSHLHAVACLCMISWSWWNWRENFPWTRLKWMSFAGDLLANTDDFLVCELLCGDCQTRSDLAENGGWWQHWPRSREEDIGIRAYCFYQTYPPRQLRHKIKYFYPGQRIFRDGRLSNRRKSHLVTAQRCCRLCWLTDVTVASDWRRWTNAFKKILTYRFQNVNVFIVKALTIFDC